MSAAVALAVARRVLVQLRGDRRTVALLLLVPPALATLLWLVLDSEPMFDRVGPQLVAIFSQTFASRVAQCFCRHRIASFWILQTAVAL